MGFWLYFILWWPWIVLFVLTSTFFTHLKAKNNEWPKWVVLIKSCVWCRVCGTFIMVRQNTMHYGREILVLVFIQQPVFRPQTGCSLFDIAITEVQRPTPPLSAVLYRQKGQSRSTVKRSRAWWLSSSKVQSDSAEAHLSHSVSEPLSVFICGCGWKRGAAHWDVKIVFNKHYGGGGLGGGYTDPEAHWSQGQNNRKEVTWLIQTHREKGVEPGWRQTQRGRDLLWDLLFSLLFFSVSLTQVSADMLGACPGVDYDIKTTTGKAERVKETGQDTIWLFSPLNNSDTRVVTLKYKRKKVLYVQIKRWRCVVTFSQLSTNVQTEVEGLCTDLNSAEGQWVGRHSFFFPLLLFTRDVRVKRQDKQRSLMTSYWSLKS